MGDHHGRLAVARDGVAQEREDLRARRRVEVAGRLVGEHDGGPGDERACDRDALLLATRELCGAVPEAVSEADRGDQLPAPGRIRPLACDRQRQEDVLLRREHREQVEELEDEADVAAPELRQPGVAERAEGRAVDPHLTRGRPVQTREKVHERRLAGARGPHDGRELALGHRHGDATQGVDRGVALAVAPAEVTGGYAYGGMARGMQGFGERGGVHVSARSQRAPASSSGERRDPRSSHGPIRARRSGRGGSSRGMSAVGGEADAGPGAPPYGWPMRLRRHAFDALVLAVAAASQVEILVAHARRTDRGRRGGSTARDRAAAVPAPLPVRGPGGRVRRGRRRLARLPRRRDRGGDVRDARPGPRLLGRRRRSARASRRSRAQRSAWRPSR